MVLIQLLLPTSGAASADALAPLAKTRRELADRFTGVTAYVRSPAKGLWTAPDGQIEQDDVVMVEVVTDMCIVSARCTTVPRMGRCSVDCTKRSNWPAGHRPSVRNVPIAWTLQPGAYKERLTWIAELAHESLLGPRRACEPSESRRSPFSADPVNGSVRHDRRPTLVR